MQKRRNELKSLCGRKIWPITTKVPENGRLKRESIERLLDRLHSVKIFCPRLFPLLDAEQGSNFFFSISLPKLLKHFYSKKSSSCMNRYFLYDLSKFLLTQIDNALELNLLLGLVGRVIFVFAFLMHRIFILEFYKTKH